MVQLMMSPIELFLENGKDLSVLKPFVSHHFVYIVYNISVFVQWSGWEGMNKPVNKLQLLSTSCKYATSSWRD